MTQVRYSYGAIALHWLIALLLFFQISLGWALDGPNSPALFDRFQLHKSVGITILVLSLIRLALRLTVPRPAPTEGPAWQRRLAETVHWLFYVVMIGTPLTGWLIVSTSKIQVPTLIWGVLPLPHLPVGHGLHDVAEQAHGLLVFSTLLLFLLHVAGALRHQWLLRKPELQRMIPFARGRAIGSFALAIALIGGAIAAGKLVYPDSAAPQPPAAAAAPKPEAAPAAASNAATVAENATEEEAEEPEPLRDWSVSPGGRLGFTARWNGDPVRGSFGKWTAAIRFSPDQLDQSSIKVTVDTASANTSDTQRDESIRGSDFLDSAAYPAARFSSTRIEALGGDRYAASGTLDLRGVKKHVRLRFTLAIDDDVARVSGTTQLDRGDFGIASSGWDAIASAVAVDFRFTARAR